MDEDKEKTPENANSDAEGPSEEYKKQQRLLSQSRERNKELISQIADIADATASAHRVEDIVIQLAERLETGETETNIAETAKERREDDLAELVTTQRLQEIVNESDKSWDDPEFAESRALLDKGEFTQSLILAQKAALSAPAAKPESTEDIEAELERRVEERLKQGARGVDNSTPTPSGSRRLTVGDVGSMFTPEMSYEEMMEAQSNAASQIFDKK